MHEQISSAGHGKLAPLFALKRAAGVCSPGLTGEEAVWPFRPEKLGSSVLQNNLKLLSAHVFHILMCEEFHILLFPFQWELKIVTK